MVWESIKITLPSTTKWYSAATSAIKLVSNARKYRTIRHTTQCAHVNPDNTVI